MGSDAETMADLWRSLREAREMLDWYKRLYSASREECERWRDRHGYRVDSGTNAGWWGNRLGIGERMESADYHDKVRAEWIKYAEEVGDGQ